jgi:hypothetical protein
MFSESASVQAALTYNPAGEQQTAATEMAQAQLQLTRIRAIRVEFMAEVDLASGGLKNLRRLAALDRYELARHHHATASRKVETFLGSGV